MPALEVASNPPDDENEDETALVPAGPVIGIIYPPPEVRNIVDKTASFVARNGPEFEARIRQNELGNPKFNFLSSGDPYHAYYQHKVKDFRDGKVAEPNSMPPGLGGAMQRLTVTAATQQRQQQLLRAAAEPPPPTEAPPDFEFIADPPSISALDLDIVKLTAQFVARNGRQFLTNLMNREQRNYQFDFLRPQHSLFHYFTRLLEQYTKVLLPPKELLPRLIEEAGSTQTVLNGAKSRAAWLSHQLAQRQKEEQKLERERVAYASIDWHDFVVVETVDYQPMELGSFPPPTTPDEVGARVLMQERIDDGGVEEIEMQLESDDDDDDSDVDKEKEEEGLSKMEDRTGHNKSEIRSDNTQVQDMEEESSSSDTEDSDSDSDDDRRRPKDSSSSMQPPAMPPQLDKVVVKKYDPKQAKRESTKIAGSAAGEEWLISPITGERIPAHKVQEHVRIGLLDSRWLEQRDRALGDRGAQDAVLAQGSAIEASLKQLAERRTDIFGVGDEETAIGKKIGEEEVRKDDRVTWDGHTSSVEAATRAARANITLEEQIHQIHKVKGLLPDEEKEKIGPKPIGGSHQQGSSQQQSSGQSQQSQSQGQSQNQSQNIPQPKPQPHMQSAQMHHPSMQPQQMPKMIPQPVVPPMGGILPQMPPLMVMSSMKPMNPMPMPPMKPPMNPIPPINPMPPMPPIMGVGPGPSFGFGGPQMRSAPPPPAEQVQLQVIDDEPPAKRARTEDSLIPEQHFIQLHPGIISFVVAVPNMPERTEWSLSGQRVPLRLPVSATVATLKAKLNQAVGMQPAKQKLHMEGLFFKDSNTLAFYNVAPGSTINLQLKERGGRKK